MDMRAIKSPRMRAHPLKRSTKKMKKLLSKSYNDDYLDGGSIKSISSSYSNSGSRYEPQASIELSREVLDDIGLLKIQLSETIEENSMMKSRLHMELKERHSLEMKNKDLTEKLLDARKGLQETGAALYKVQQATDQLMRKRDQREIQLQRALDGNSAYEAKIAELEAKLVKTEDGSKVQATIASYRKIINEKDDIIRILEEQQFTSQNQLAKIKRENQRFIEEKMDYEFSLETKQKKINLLEANFRFLEEKLSGPDGVNLSKQSLFDKLMDQPFNASLTGKSGKLDDNKTNDNKNSDNKDKEKDNNNNSSNNNSKSGSSSGDVKNSAEYKLLETRMAQLENHIIRQSGPRTPNGNLRQQNNNNNNNNSSNSNANTNNNSNNSNGNKLGGENDSLFFSGSVVEAAGNPNAFGAVPPVNSRPDSQGRNGPPTNLNSRLNSPPGQQGQRQQQPQMQQQQMQQQQLQQQQQQQQFRGPPGMQQGGSMYQQGPPQQLQQQLQRPQFQQAGPPQNQFQQQQQGPPPQMQQQPQYQAPIQQQQPFQQQVQAPQQQFQAPAVQQQPQFQQLQQFQQQVPPQFQQQQQRQGPPVMQQQPTPAPVYQAPVVQQAAPAAAPVYQPTPVQQAAPQYQQPAPVLQQQQPPTVAFVNGAPVTVALNVVDPAQQYSTEARKTPLSKPNSRASIIDSLLQTTAQQGPQAGRVPSPRQDSVRQPPVAAAPAPVVAAAPAVTSPAPTAAPSSSRSRGTIVANAPPASAKVSAPPTPANATSVTESLEDGGGDSEYDQLQKEKKELKKMIYVWTKDFVTQHQREPTKEEREGDAKDMFKRYRTNSKLIKDYEDKLAAGGGAVSSKMKGMSIKE